MKATPHPDNIVTRIEALQSVSNPTEQQRRILTILSDKSVKEKARHVLRQLHNTPKETKDAQHFGDFWSFIDAAAAVLDEQPYGSKLREGGDAEFNFRNDELHAEFSSAQQHAIKLTKLIPTIAPSINSAFSIDKSRSLRTALAELIAACSEQCFRLTTRANGVNVFPDSSPQAKGNNWHAWVMRRLAILSEIHIGKQYLAFVIAIHRALLDLKEPFDMNSAKRSIGGKATVLDTKLAKEINAPKRKPRNQKHV